MGYVLATPALHAAECDARRRNLGDELVRDRVIALLGSEPDLIISTRHEPSDSEMQVILSVGILVVAGTNQLSPNFRIIQNVDIDKLARAKVQVHCVAIGISGEYDTQADLDVLAKRHIAYIKRSGGLIAARDRATFDYLCRQLPDSDLCVRLAGCVVSTSFPYRICPESDDRPSVIFTVTERKRFLIRDVILVLRISLLHRRARITFVGHQGPPTDWVCLGRLFPSRKFVRRLIDKVKFHILIMCMGLLGIDIVFPTSAQELVDVYSKAKCHIGSRVHAHLLCISLRCPSVLFASDKRAVQFAATYGFGLSSIYSRLGQIRYSPGTHYSGLSRSMHEVCSQLSFATRYGTASKD
jgi:hypothetical protein